MQITCSTCGSDVDAQPPAYRCPQCNAELEAQLEVQNVQAFDVQDTTAYHYRQAADLAMQGETEAALRTIDKALAHKDASQLHLLAALIHRRRKEFDQMRGHVAAIPMDDVLRPEGEWLLREHQRRLQVARSQSAQSQPQSGWRRWLPSMQRLRPRGRDEHPSSPPRSSISRSPLSRSLRELYPLDAVARRRPAAWLVALTAFAAILALVWWQSDQLAGAIGGWSQGLPSVAERLPQPTSTIAASPTGARPVTATAPAEQQSASTVATSSLPADSPPTDTETATPPPAPSSTPAAVTFLTAELTAIAGSPEPLAARGTDDAVLALAAEVRFPLDIYFQLLRRPDLGELPVRAARAEGTLRLIGSVSTHQQRSELVELAANIPGVERVDGRELIIRLPDSYRVQEGETLWIIADKLYGDGARWEDLYAANAAALGEDPVLQEGQELTVPPLETGPLPPEVRP